jgi:hypothetical protein
VPSCCGRTQTSSPAYCHGTEYRLPFQLTKASRATLARLFIRIGVRGTAIEYMHGIAIRIPALDHNLMCGAVFALIRHAPDPLLQRCRQVHEAAWLASLQATQEVPSHILDAALDFALRLRPVRGGTSVV